MSAERNAIANYLEQLYSVLISSALLPLFPAVIELIAYGLIKFYALMCTAVCAGLMANHPDMTPALRREVATLKSKPESGKGLASPPWLFLTTLDTPSLLTIHRNEAIQ